MKRIFLGLFVLLNIAGLLASVANGRAWWSAGHGVEGAPPPTLLGPTIVSNLTFTAAAGDANSSVGTLSTTISVGRSLPHYTLVTTCGTLCAQSNLFAISGASLNVGSTDIVCSSSLPCAYHITVLDTDGAASVTNNPFSQSLTLTGQSPPLVLTMNPSSATEPCAVTAGSLVSTASTSGGDGNAVAYSMTGNTTDLIINSSTGAVTIAPGGVHSADCGNSYTNTIAPTQP